MRALITGYSGFVGPYLTRHLLECGDEVHGLLFFPEYQPPPFLRAAVAGVRTLTGDLRQGPAAIGAWLRVIRPDAIYHLAAQSHVPTAWQDPAGTYDSNVLATIHLLDAARAAAPEARVLLVSSGDVYGDPPDDRPLDEDSLLRPANPYSASKAAAEQISRVYARAYGMRIFCARPFNHTGPGQSPNFVCPAFARQLARIRLGLDPPVARVGDLTPQRDFLDVRDVVRAYRIIALGAQPAEVFNVAAGLSRPIRWILDRLIDLSGMAVEVRIDPARFRRSDTPVIRAGVGRIQSRLGWRPEIDFLQTLADLFEYHLREEAAPRGVDGNG